MLISIILILANIGHQTQTYRINSKKFMSAGIRRTTYSDNQFGDNIFNIYEYVFKFFNQFYTSQTRSLIIIINTFTLRVIRKQTI